MSRGLFLTKGLVGIGVLATLAGGLVLLDERTDGGPNNNPPSFQAELNFEYATLEGQLRDATAVISGTVLEELPMTKNTGSGWTDAPGVEVLPVRYQGYVVEAKR